MRLRLLLGLVLAMVVAGCAGPAPAAQPAEVGSAAQEAVAVAPIDSPSQYVADRLGRQPLPERTEPQPIAQARGEQAPQFRLALLGGGTLNLADLRGKPVVVNFMASWCPPCRAEMPAFERAWQKHKDRVVFVGVAVEDTESAAKALVEKTGVTYPVGLDEGNVIARAYELKGMPTTVFLDPNGAVVKRVTGEVTEGALTFFINLMAPKAP
jgi:thiol-disulfide isomerase/thioredoxin